MVMKSVIQKLKFLHTIIIQEKQMTDALKLGSWGIPNLVQGDNTLNRQLFPISLEQYFDPRYTGF